MRFAAVTMALLALLAASKSQDAPSAIDAVRQLVDSPDLWPKELELTRDTQFPVVFKGKTAGTVKAPAGAKVRVVTIEHDLVEVSFRDGHTKLPHDATNLAELAVSPPPSPSKQEAAADSQAPANPFDEAMRKAMEGHPGAASAVARYYERGEGVDQSNKKAYTWYRVAQELNKALVDETRSKLAGIIVPEVNFVETPVLVAIEDLRKKSIALDNQSASSNRKGVQVTTRLDDNSAAQTITLGLTNQSLGALFEYITRLANLRMKVDPSGVEFTTFGGDSAILLTREYLWPKSLSEGSPVGGDVKDLLMSQGVGFPSGAAANLLPSSGRLIVRNSEENLDLVQAIIEGAGGQEHLTPPIQRELAESLSTKQLKWAEDEASELLSKIGPPR